MPVIDVADVERVAAAAVGVAADDVRTLFARRLLHAAQAEVEDVVVNVGALRDRGKCRFFRLGDVVEVAGVGLEVLDVRLDRYFAPLPNSLPALTIDGISMPPT